MTDGVLESVVWLDGDEASGIDDRGVVVAPGLHRPPRPFPGAGQRGRRDDRVGAGGGGPRRVHDGLPDAEHDSGAGRPGGPRAGPGGGRRVGVAGPGARVRSGVGGPRRGDAGGARRAGRRGRRRVLGRRVAGLVRDRSCATRWPTPARSACRSSTMPRTRRSRPAPRRTTASSRRCWGCAAGRPRPRRRPSPATWRSSPTSSATCPGARLHLTHLSTGGALELVRRAKAAGLPVTCDVTPHHLALTDEWLAGARRWAWEASGDPWADRAITAAPYAPSLRVNPPLRSPADAAACREALVDGTADAIATDHAPHTQVDKDVEFGLAANGISGIETALGVVLAAVDAGLITLPRAIEALTVGPARVLGRGRRRSPGRPGRGRAGGPRGVRPRRRRGRSPRTRWPRKARTRRSSAESCPAGCC